MNTFHPRRITTVHVEQVGEELCIYDWNRNHVHSLNVTAASVWGQCDGHTTPAEMADALRAALKTPDAEMLVALALRQLEAARLLESGTTSSVERRPVSRRDLLKQFGKTAALVPTIISITAPRPVDAQSAGSVTFDYSGAVQTFTVPAGLTNVSVAAYGAAGGGSITAGGTGGLVTATIAVTPGEVLSIYVGGKGSDALGYGIEPVSGGFNGGGGSAGCGAGGGGASDVRRGSTKLVIAGGGGGTATGGRPWRRGGWHNGY